MPSLLLPDRAGAPSHHYGAVQNWLFEDSRYDETESFRGLLSGQASFAKLEIVVPPTKHKASGRFAGAFLAIPDANPRLLSSELA